MSNQLTLTLGALVLAIGAGTAAYASQTSRHEDDAFTDLAQTKVSISQAIASAEQAATGKSTRAELENQNGDLVYTVEVANASTQKVMDVKVDSVSGKVLSMKEDQADHEGRDEADND